MAIIVWQMVLPPDNEIKGLLQIFDWGFCALFLFDWMHSIVTSKHRLHYVFTWGLFDLASSIPAVHGLRLLRFARILRVLQLIRTVRILGQVYRHDRTAFAVALMLLAGIGVIIGVTAAVLHVERGAEGASITTASEAAWWAVVTVSTVGYGDYAPVTDTGRILAVILMITGIGLFATFAGALANLFMRHLTSTLRQSDLEARLKDLEARQAAIMHRHRLGKDD